MSEYEITTTQQQELQRLEQGIEFSDETRFYMSKVALLGVTSPSATGSTTLIEKTGFPKVPGATTRNQRHKGEAGIRFLPHTAAVIDECIDKARAGELVQIRLSGEGRVYLSETVDYQQGQLHYLPYRYSSLYRSRSSLLLTNGLCDLKLLVAHFLPTVIDCGMILKVFNLQLHSAMQIMMQSLLYW